MLNRHVLMPIKLYANLRQFDEFEEDRKHDE